MPCDLNTPFEEVQVYSPESLYKQGLGKIIKGMWLNLVKSRELIWQLFLRDFKSLYKQSLLGWAWLFLMPIITMGTFLVLNISGVIRIVNIPVPYPIFGLLGFSVWQIFASGWSVLTYSVLGSSALITRINFPKEALIFASFGRIVVDFCIRLGLVLIVYFVYGLLPSIWILLMPLYILPLFLLTLGLGFLSSLLNVVIHDTVNFINVGLNFFLFLMPVMYTLPEKGFLAKINRFNPIFFLIEVPREIIISGKISSIGVFLLSSFLALLIFFFGWLVFYISQAKVTERV